MDSSRDEESGTGGETEKQSQREIKREKEGEITTGDRGERDRA